MTIRRPSAPELGGAADRPFKTALPGNTQTRGGSFARNVSRRRSFLMFALVGTGGFLVDYSVLALLLWAGLNGYAGQLLAFMVATVFTWLCNRNVTFASTRSDARLFQFMRFAGVVSIGGGINNVVFAALYTFSSTVTAHPVLGVAAGSIAGLGFNFAGASRLVFASSGRRAQVI